MSQENVQIVRRAFEAYQRGDVTAMLKDAHPDVVTTRAAPQPDAGTYHGPEGFVQSLADWVEGFDKFTATPEQFIDAGDCVVVCVHERARGVSSGAAVEADFWFVHTLRDGQIVRLDMFSSREPAFEAAGLQE